MRKDQYFQGEIKEVEENIYIWTEYLNTKTDKNEKLTMIMHLQEVINNFKKNLTTSN